MITKLSESKTIVFGLALCALALLLFVIAAVASASGVNVPYVDAILDFMKVTFLGTAAKNAADNNIAPTAAAMKSGHTEAPPISKWAQPSDMSGPQQGGPSNPYGGGS